MNHGRQTAVDRIHVGAPTDDGRGLARRKVGRKIPRHDGVFGDFHLLETHRFEFLGKEVRKIKFLGVTRHDPRLRITLRGNGDVTEEPFKEFSFLIHFSTQKIFDIKKPKVRIFRLRLL